MIQRIALGVVVVATMTAPSGAQRLAAGPGQPSGGEGPAAGRGQSPGAVQARSEGPVLRMARSADGLEFTDTGEVFLRNAWWPGLLRLPNGHLLAVFQYGRGAGKDQTSALACSCSRDDGRAWLPPERAAFQGLAPESSPTGHADLVLMPSGLVRLYLGAGGQTGASRAGPDTGSMASAVTRNGTAYRLDLELRVPVGRDGGGVASVFQAGRQFLMLVTPEANAGPQAARRPPTAIVLTSSDGRRFRPGRRMPLPGSICDVVQVRGGEYRMYVAVGDEIHSMLSPDGMRWREERGARLRGASDAAVVQLGDGTYLMVYCTGPDQRSSGVPEQALASADGQSADTGGGPAQGQTWEPFTEAGLEAELGGEVGGAAGGGAQAEAGFDDANCDLFAPLPDFTNPIDYINWYEESFVPPPGENAYEAYEEMFSPENVELARELKDMFNSAYDGPPGPWDPGDHPDWEASYQVSRDLREAFRSTCLDPRAYGSPLQFNTGDASSDGETPEPYRLLLNVILPSLARYRNLCKATLGDAWRMEDGVVSAEGMRDAWTTVLSNAAHLDQGACLIEGLVGLGERNLVEHNARWALRQGVFRSADQVEAALETLQEHDWSQADPERWLRLEHAFLMDTAQHLFGPGGAGGQPTSSRERIERYAGAFGLHDDDIEGLANLSPDQVGEAIGIADQHYREFAQMWKTGYPQVRAEDVEKLGERRALSNPLLKIFLPSLGRAYQLHTRGEASRRATQLAYGVHLFKLRQGRWPATLDELPPEHRDYARTDPFTGADFGYRLTAEGPTIYSREDNGVDDGGVHNPDRRDEKINSDDYVFWPPRGK